ncbi:hypothetical protein DFH08DRAFT_1085720 [Mycena albidolilacea]|uniref:Uncharacterized protein n=1 Tax=Mycena albidolilacea TaxID=1033008 RepID=A0AAD6ZGY9_9AGAR|nr:hypothetical protein DFH08DRAFT_1085720 [Mycena albidolilacea]
MHGVDTRSRPGTNHDSVRVLDFLDYLRQNQWAELLGGLCGHGWKDDRKSLRVVCDIGGWEESEYNAHIRIGMGPQGKSGGDATRRRVLWRYTGTRQHQLSPAAGDQCKVERFIGTRVAETEASDKGAFHCDPCASRAKQAVPSTFQRPKASAAAKLPLTAEVLLQLTSATSSTRLSRIDFDQGWFNCGNYGRIGARHRETRTLYLSDLIDVTSCKDPEYLKIHAGCYISLTLDEISRTAALADVTSQKRPHTDAQTTDKSKRRKTSKKGIKDEIQVWQVTATQCCFISTTTSIIPHESSSSPSVKRLYQQHEYFNVIITSKIRDGATGIVHRAVLRTTDKGSESLEQNVVVKFAFLKDQQRRLRHEYEAYRGLVAHDVTGASEVYGIFEDFERGPIALVIATAAPLSAN